MAKREKHLPNISVRTLANGYSLEFKGMAQQGGYIYFTPDKLLEGFMLHIGMNMTEQLNPQTMKDFIKAATSCKDTKAMMKEIEKVRDEIAKMNAKYHALVVRMINERRRLVFLVDDIKSAHGYTSVSEIKKILGGALKGNATLKLLTLKDFGYKSTDIIEDTEEEDDDD